MCLSWDPPECQRQCQKHRVSCYCMHLPKPRESWRVSASEANLCKTGQNFPLEFVKKSHPETACLVCCTCWTQFLFWEKVLEASSFVFGLSKEEELGCHIFLIKIIKTSKDPSWNTSKSVSASHFALTHLIELFYVSSVSKTRTCPATSQPALGCWGGSLQAYNWHRIVSGFILDYMAEVPSVQLNGNLCL